MIISHVSIVILIDRSLVDGSSAFILFTFHNIPLGNIKSVREMFSVVLKILFVLVDVKIFFLIIVVLRFIIILCFLIFVMHDRARIK